MYGEQLRYFALAYQLHSYSAAAKRIPMSPQGLAKSVHSLESELGVKLFGIDENGDLLPTAYADELLEFAGLYDTGFALLQESFNRIRAQESRQVNIGVGLGILGYLGPNFIAKFASENPDISVTYDEISDRDCDEGLRTGLYDIALTVAPYPTDFITVELYRTPMCFWVSADDPLASKDQLEINDFEGRSIGIPGKSFKCFETIANKCSDAKVTLDGVYTSAEIFRLFEFARQGKGLGFTAQHLVDMPLYRNDESVVGVPLADTWWKFGAAHPASKALSESAQVFLDYCIGELAS